MQGVIIELLKSLNKLQITLVFFRCKKTFEIPNMHFYKTLLIYINTDIDTCIMLSHAYILFYLYLLRVFSDLSFQEHNYSFISSSNTSVV